MKHEEDSRLVNKSDDDDDDDFYQSAADISPNLSSNDDSNSIPSTNSVYYSAEHEKWRNLTAYWLLGLTNNFAYVVMLSAAHDILSNDFAQYDHEIPYNTTNNSSNPRDCNTKSTGTILLVDIIPSLVIKVLAPFMCFHVHLRITIVATLCTLAFLLVGVASSFSTAILGVVCASASSGLGESTFLAYSTFFHRDVISTYSSGTGAAGLFGSLSYAALTSIGLSPSQTILIMLVVPLIMVLSFWNLLEHPSRQEPCWKTLCTLDENTYEQLSQSPELALRQSTEWDFACKMRFIPSLVKYMVPLILVYMAEYLANQGLSELIYFPDAESWISHSEQYRWYQVLYQVGVLVSRSSVNLIHIERVWILAVLQWLNIIVLLTAAIYWWIGSIWAIFAFILWEGLLGGAAYVNTFYKVSVEIPPERRQFSMQVISMSDTAGITISGFLAIPIHNYICRLPL